MALATEEQRQHLADRIYFDPRQRNATPRNLKDVAEGVCLVGQMREDLGAEWKGQQITDIELLSAEWEFQFSIDNESKGEQTKKEKTTLGMTATSGKEVANSVSASAGFSGWGFSAEVNASTETRTFNSIETSDIREVEDTYTCPPESSIFVYKRRYRFRCRAWFSCEVRNAWCEWNESRMEAVFVNEITANQELISPVALGGQGKITNNPLTGLARPSEGADVSRDIVWLVMRPRLGDQYPWLSMPPVPWP